MPVTMRDVAQQAGVSIKTVSRVVNHQAEISDATRQRVLAVIDTLGYRPNALARALVTQRTQIIGLVVVTLDNPYFTDIARGVQAAGREHAYQTFLATSDEDAHEEQHILESLVAYGVDGLIVYATSCSDGYLARFAERFRPLVLIHGLVEHPNISHVRPDFENGARLAVDYLIGRGHRTIGMLANVESPPARRWRERGYASSLGAHGLVMQPDWIERDLAKIEEGCAATRRLLTRQPELTAIFAYNDMMAIGALKACRELGRRVPEDCAIVGFDDTHLATVVMPSLTTVRVDKRELGRQAFLRLLEQLHHPDALYPPLVLPPELVIRESA